ncbi:MAG TPA: hypothetical protein VFF52_26540 [Isosphaeraceae bacterium]|nr:hypothetical protein [Isosphaeraceae bacterium]
MSQQLSVQQREILGRFIKDRLPRMLADAKRLLRGRCLDTARLAAEDAVQGALVKLCHAVAEGTIAPIKTLDGFLRAFRLMLRQHIAEQLSRANAVKRGGPGEAQDARTHASRKVNADLDAIESGWSQPDVQAIAQEQFERSLALLDGHDRLLRAIVVLKVADFTNREIASSLGLSLWRVEEMLRQTRSILESRRADADRSRGQGRVDDSTAFGLRAGNPSRF